TMSAPTGLVFFMRVHYENNPTGTRSEAWTQEAAKQYAKRMSTADAEKLGSVNSAKLEDGDPVLATGDAWKEMAFTIEKATVTAESQKLKARYTRELEQDLRKI